MRTIRAHVECDTVGLPGGLSLQRDVHSYRDLALGVFLDRLTSQDLRYVREVSLALSAEAPSALAAMADPPILALRDEHGEACVFVREDAVAYVSLSTRSGSAMVAAADAGRADALAEMISARLGTGHRGDHEIAVDFWTAGTVRPRSARREIAAPRWEDVRGNYASSTRTGVDELTGAEVPSAGRLVLWHGEPGTGKTSALRALARAWSTWCSTHFITDPEHFLGHGTGYLLDVLTASPTPRTKPAIEWKLIVLEDAGEPLTVDAHERTGQALARLLNVSDGLLGQGMNVITLVTTNEPLGRLHPAVTRPGRCWRTVEFLPLAEPDANAWLTNHGSSVRVTHAATLAELYAALHGQPPAVKRDFGFGLRASADGR